MKIFLVYLAINSPQNYGYNCGLGYISSVLKKRGHDIDYIVLKNKKDIPGFYEKLKYKQPQIVGFSATTSQFNYLKNIAPRVKKISPSFTVCGGVHSTLEPECIFEISGLDAVLRGEGEFPLVELADALQEGCGYTQINNFWFKTEGGVAKNPLRPYINDLDQLPFPDKECLDYQKVINESYGSNHFIFSRGCIFDCAYCSNKALSEIAEGPYFRQLSPKAAMEMLSSDAEKYKFEFIIIDDDTISLNKKWFYDFFTSYKKKFRYPFRCNLRPGTVDDDMVKLLKDCKATYIGIGIEHGNEKFRRAILKRDISDEEIAGLCRLCEKYGITHSDFVMVGFPYENKRLFFDTVKLCREVRTAAKAAIFSPYPGTELGRICRQRNWLPKKEFFREREEAVISYPGFKKSDIQLCHDTSRFLFRCRFIPPKILLSVPLSIFLKAALVVYKVLYKLAYPAHKVLYNRVCLYRLIFRKRLREKLSPHPKEIQ